MFTTILLTGIGLSVLQLAAGLGLGLWIARRRAEANGRDLQRAHRVATELDSITAEVGRSIDSHADQVRRLDERLREESQSAGEGRGPLTDLVVGVVGELLTANGRLSSALAQSRAELADRLDELNEHRQQALTDPLTGLPNRRAFDDRLRDGIEGWRKRRSAFSLMMIDVDHFKRFNDQHGHQAGDAALRAVADALRGALRNHDLVARYGGEEFAVILPFTTLELAGPAVAKALEAVATADIATPTGRVQATASIGLAAVMPQDSGETVVERADEALYAAKRGGRNQAWQHDGSLISPMAASQAANGSPAESAESAELLDTQPVELQLACNKLSASLESFMQDGDLSERADSVAAVSRLD